MPRKGLGKGLDSLIPPDFYNEDFDSNTTQSLEDLLGDDEKEENESSIEETESSIDEKTSDENEKNIFEEVEQEENDKGDEQHNESEEENVSDDDDGETDTSSEVNNSDRVSEEVVPDSQEEQIIKEHIAEVKEIVDKNPRITLWSSRSSAVFRYLRKTEPEFSISKEASTLIDEAVSKKYRPFFSTIISCKNHKIVL